MTRTISPVDTGDLHMAEADGWQSRERLEMIVAEIGAHRTIAADLVFLPGDNAHHGTFAQYRTIAEALARLGLPGRVFLGDHDFEPGNLDNHSAAVPEGTQLHRNQNGMHC